MKLLTIAIMSMALNSFAKEQVAEEPALISLNSEEIELFDKEAKDAKEAPSMIVIRTNMKTGARSVHYPDGDLVPGNLVTEAKFEDLEEFDGQNMVDEGDAADVDPMGLLMYQPNWNSRWYHDRSRGYSFRHRYDRGHPYGPYYGRRYGPVYGYGRYYDRPYRFRPYPYNPYYRYDLGDLIYTFIRRAIN